MKKLIFRYTKVDGSTDDYPKGVPRDFNSTDIKRDHIEIDYSDPENIIETILDAGDQLDSIGSLSKGTVENDFLSSEERSGGLTSIEKEDLKKERKQKVALPIFEKFRRVHFLETRWIGERQCTSVTNKLSDEDYLKWIVYWDALRDMSAQEGFDAAHPQWPDRPGDRPGIEISP